MTSLKHARWLARHPRHKFFNALTPNGYAVSTCWFGDPPYPVNGAFTGVSLTTCDHWGGLACHRYDMPVTPGGLAEAHAHAVDLVSRGKLDLPATCLACAGRWDERPGIFSWQQWPGGQEREPAWKVAER